MMHKSIHDISSRNSKLYYTICMAEGDTKDTCQFRKDKPQEVQLMQTEYYCEVYRDIPLHHTNEYPFNMKNEKERWCVVWK